MKNAGADLLAVVDRQALRVFLLVLSFFFFFTLVTGPRRSLSLKLSDTRVYEPQIRAKKTAAKQEPPPVSALTHGMSQVYLAQTLIAWGVPAAVAGIFFITLLKSSRGPKGDPLDDEASLLDYLMDHLDDDDAASIPPGPSPRVPCLQRNVGFRVQGSGFRVQGLGFGDTGGELIPDFHGAYPPHPAVSGSASPPRSERTQIRDRNANAPSPAEHRKNSYPACPPKCPCRPRGALVRVSRRRGQQRYVNRAANPVPAQKC